jgi:tetratricopeptide (TPR) repeat protein
MSASRNLAALAAAASEGLAFAALLRELAAPALVLHAAACCCTAGLLHRRLLEGPPRTSFALLFAGTFFVPILGALGLIAVALLAPRPAASSEPDCVATPIPRVPGAAELLPAPDAEPADGQQARLAALAALRERTEPGSVAHLRRALEDPEEEMRLLAHALLETKSRGAYRRIDEATHALESAPEHHRGPLHKRVAFEHWELAWLGLAEGECLSHTLEMARRHVLDAIEQEPRAASLHFLLGRIDLRLGGPEKAEAALRRAFELGLPAALVLPYLAESAFLRRRFDLVRTHLAEAAALHASETVDRVQRFWS